MDASQPSNSRAQARTWPYPRHRTFEESVRQAATQWFKDHGHTVNAQYPYILAEWKDWPANIICSEVVKLVEAERQRREAIQEGFPLHKFIHHGLSSQAMVFNLVGPLKALHARALKPDLQVSHCTANRLVGNGLPLPNIPGQTIQGKILAGPPRQSVQEPEGDRMTQLAGSSMPRNRHRGRIDYRLGEQFRWVIETRAQ